MPGPGIKVRSEREIYKSLRVVESDYVAGSGQDKYRVVVASQYPEDLDSPNAKEFAQKEAERTAKLVAPGCVKYSGVIPFEASATPQRGMSAEEYEAAVTKSAHSEGVRLWKREFILTGLEN